MARTDARIDAYIEKAQPFAQPILRQLRAIVHEACPEVEETIKWGFPHFDYLGEMMCSMAAFKAHCAFGFWKGPQLVGTKSRNGEAMGDFGRVITMKDLPAKPALKALIKQAMRLNETGVKRVARKTPVPPKPLKIPRDFAAALEASKRASIHWDEFSPSARREYIEWISEAKAEATRERRLEQALEWIVEGKHRNWKYQRKGK